MPFLPKKHPDNPLFEDSGVGRMKKEIWEASDEEVAEVEGELEEVDLNDVRKKRNIRQNPVNSLEGLIKLGKERNYRKKFKSQFRWMAHC